MLGKTSGFASLVNKEVPHHHCDSLLFALTCIGIKNFIINFKKLSTSVKVVNFVRARALNHRIFKKFCQEMDAQHEVLLYHTEVRWLSKGQVLERSMELRKKVFIFFKEKQRPLSLQCNCKEFLCGLAYLGDIFSPLNEVNL